MSVTLRRLNSCTRRFAVFLVHHPVVFSSFQTWKWVHTCVRLLRKEQLSNRRCTCSFSIAGRLEHLSRNCHVHFQSGCLLQQPAKSFSNFGPQVQKSDTDHGKGNDCVKEYSTIYRFPAMRFLRVVSRFKIAQTFFTVGIMPPMWYLYTVGRIAETQLIYSLSVATFALVMLYAMSFFLRCIIGFIYLHRNRDSIKVAHMTFWGKRRDLTIPVADVMPIGETREKTRDILIKLKRYSTKETLYFSLKYGWVTDREGFCEVFGDF